jgi:two-component system sensor histidine kinase/response regulator
VTDDSTLSAGAVPRYRVLLVEDDPEVPELVRALLRDDGGDVFDLDDVATRAAAHEALRTGTYHAVLLDLDLPDAVHHLGTLGELREIAPEVPVVVLSATEDHDVALETVRTGAQDHLPKRLLTTYTLTRVLRHAIERSRWQQRLAQETLELRQVNARLEEFAELVAHDLKGPLTSVLGLAHTVRLVDAGTLSPRQRELLERLAGAADRLCDVVDGLLDATRQPDLAQRRPVDLDELARDVAAMLGPTVPDAGARIRVAPLPVVWGVPALLRQALQNVVGNAIAHHGGVPLIEISADVDDDIVVTVADDGPGIPPEVRDRVFERGYTSGGTGHAGRGLGLAAARAAVIRMGGDIWIEDAPIGGAAVRFSLPRRSLVEVGAAGQPVGA